MSNGNYGTYDPQAAQDAQNSRWYKPTTKPEGELLFLCPPWSKTQKLPWYQISVHWKVDGSNPVACPRNFNMPCPVCEANNDVRSRKDDAAAQNLSRDIYAKPTFFYNVLAPVKLTQVEGGKFVISYAGDPAREVKIKPYPASKAFQKQIDQILGFGSGIFDPMNGRALHLTKISSGSDPKAPPKIQLVPHPERGFFDSKLMDLMNNLPDLTKELVPKSYDELKAMVDVIMAGYRASKLSGVVTTANLPPMNIPNNVPFVGTPISIGGGVSGGSTPPPPFIAGVPSSTATTIPAGVTPVVGGNVNELDVMEADIRRRAAGK